MADAPDAPAPDDPRAPNTRSGVSPAGPRRRFRRGIRTIGLAVAALVALVIVVVVVVLQRAQPAHPGSFYAVPSPLPGGKLGSIIRTEPLDHLPAGAVGWRILYLSTSYTGKPTAISGVVIAPTTPPPTGGRKVVAWAHGTIGIASNCAPSLLGGAGLHFIDGLPAFLKAGDAVVATDYQGMGTPGPHPYLVGKSEADAVLDSVRAAHNLAGVGAGATFVVWGVSQGGHAALFTGQYAASYAPDLKLVGVAAAAPATALIPLFQGKIGTDFGNLLAAYALDSWAQVYPDLKLDQVVTAAARPIVRNTATYCIQNMTQALPAVLHAKVLKITFLSKQPWDIEPWKSELETNTAGHMPIRTPLFIGQGATDPLVLPSVQADFVKRLCTVGSTVEYRTYPGVQHVDAGPATVSDATAWIAARFAGTAAPSTCG
jgi:alpha-beta hydrolase superfamily lysophospholipase